MSAFESNEEESLTSKSCSCGCAWVMIVCVYTSLTHSLSDVPYAACARCAALCCALCCVCVCVCVCVRVYLCAPCAAYKSEWLCGVCGGNSFSKFDRESLESSRESEGKSEQSALRCVSCVGRQVGRGELLTGKGRFWVDSSREKNVAAVTLSCCEARCDSWRFSAGERRAVRVEMDLHVLLAL